MSKRELLNIGILGPSPLPHGGVTRLIENHTIYWEEMGFKSYLIPYNFPKKPKNLKGIELVNWRTVPMGAFPPIFCFSNAILRFPFLRWDRLLAYNRALNHLIRDKKIDILYAHHADKMGLSAILQTKKLGIPSVVVSYGQTWLVDRYDRKVKHLQKYVLKNASYVVSTSEHCKRGALNLGCQKDKISVIYAGLDLNKFRPGLDRVLFRKKYDIPADAVVISILGLALKRKLDVLLEAVKYLENIPNRVILIGGTGVEFDYIRTFVGSLNKDFIRVLGFISEEDLPYFYAATDVFVTAPKTIIECMGLSMKESMACGVPVVGANIGGIPEAIIHGETGLLFENGDVKDMVFQINRILEDKILKNKIVKQAREYVEKTFELRRLACKTTDLFYDLLT